MMYCYVGDLLGFKNIILNLDPDDQAKRVDEWIEFVLDGVREFDLPRYQLVSDTIFAGANHNKQGLEKLIDFARYMLEKGIIKSFPIRGAISFGEITWNKYVTFGRAIVDSYNHANSQNWIGTSCENDIPFLDDLWSFDRIFVYPTPLKEGNLMMMRPVVAWDVPPIEDLESYIELKGLTSEHEGWNWKQMGIIQNTILFSLYLKQVNAELIKLVGEKEEVLNASPTEFPGLTPMEPTEYYMNLFLSTLKTSEQGKTFQLHMDG